MKTFLLISLHFQDMGVILLTDKSSLTLSVYLNIFSFEHGSLIDKNNQT